MGKLSTVIIVVTAVAVAAVSYFILRDGELPELEESPYWGPKAKQASKQDISIRPFEINITKKAVEEFSSRLKLEIKGNRFTEPLEGIGFQYGINSKFLKTVLKYWSEKYDWKQREKLLNKHPHFKTKISGLDIHFQLIKSTNNKKYKKTRPLLLIHGWPGSFAELRNMVAPLLDPEDSEINFELVIPSIPGFGFSEAAHRPGLATAEIAQIFHTLMLRLGFGKYYSFGFDWGSIISANLATLYKENVIGIHMSMCVSHHPRSQIKMGAAYVLPPLFMDEDEQKHFLPITRTLTKLIRESAYVHLQASKPDTLGIALQNTPTGLAAHLLEKFSFWTNENWVEKEDGGIFPHYNIDELLDNIMIYWFTNSITTTMRLYAESLNPSCNQFALDRVPTDVPAGCLNMPHELLAFPKFALTEKFRNLVRFSYAKTGGHFGGFEVPQLVTKDIITTFNLVENSITSTNKKHST